MKETRVPSKIEEFSEWFSNTVNESVPENPDEFTRKQLVDYIDEALWERFEARGGIIPPDDSLGAE